MTHRILIVEDEPSIAELIAINLTHAGYEVEKAMQADLAQSMMKEHLPNLVILDWMLPGKSGVQFAKELRANERTRGLPILMLTARDAVNDRVEGLDAGADDYLVKPFDLPELLARLRALLRRRAPAELDGGILRFEDLTVNTTTREVTRGDRRVDLTKIEFELLELLITHPRQVLTRDQILDLVWGYNFDSGTNSLAVYVGYLRRKLEEGGESRLVQTIRGVGYALRES